MLPTPNIVKNKSGVSMVEALLGLTILGVCLLSFIASTGRLEQGRHQNVMRTKALAAAAEVMQDIRSLAWDESAVRIAKVNNLPNNGRGIMSSAHSAIGEELITMPDETEVSSINDVDDYDGKTIVNGPFTTNVQVYYVNVPTDGTPFSITGKMSSVSNFKLVITSTTWQSGCIVLKTIVANGR